MRTNLNLDEDVHLFASIYAEANGLTLSAALNDLVRQVEKCPPQPVELGRSPNGLPCFPPTGRKLTLKMIKEAESEID